MRTLTDLLNSPEGLRLLASHRIFTAPSEFVAVLKPPQKPALATQLGRDGQYPVWAGQQLYADCTRSMVHRIKTLRELGQASHLYPYFLWVDTDRAGSDWLITRFHWPFAGKLRTLRLCLKSAEVCEMRFIQLDPTYLRKTIDDLGQYYINSIRNKQQRQQARARFEPLRALFLAENPGTLSAFNYRLSHFLLQAAGFEPNSVVLSDLLDESLLTPAVNLILNAIDDVVRVFNETVTKLLGGDIDPQVRPLSEDYLPLHYACPVDNRRLKLRRQIQGRDQYAVTACKCGADYRFHLGSRLLSISELEQTRRWSPDVMLPLFLNQVTSGYVGGQSSAIYFGLVMQAVLEKALDQRRIPILTPMNQVGWQRAAPDSLLYEYLRLG